MTPFFRILYLLLAISGASVTCVLAQTLHDVRSLGMGGSSVSIATGVHAAATNPANLMIYDRKQRWTVVVGHGGYRFSKGYDTNTLSRPFDYLGAFYPSDNNSAFPTTDTRENLINQWFGQTSAQSINEHTLDVLLLGISYTGKNFGIALSHRVRGESNFQIGRGWYDPNFIATNGTEILDRSLEHNQFFRHEIGAAIAWEYDLVSGWTSDLSRIYIGFNPKAILPTIYAENNLTSVYERNFGSSDVTHTSSYSGRSAGFSTEIHQAQVNAILAGSTAVQEFSFSDINKFSGLGLGFDAGITYILALDKDLSLTTRNRIPTRYSMRISAAVTDIGFISYNDNVARWSASNEVENMSQAPDENMNIREYQGNPTEFFNFANESGEAEFVQRMESGSTNPARLMLPSRAHVGAALQLNRLVLAGEIQHPLDSQSLSDDNTSFHLGSELRLLRFLPLRAGIILESKKPIFYTAGAGLDLRNIVISASTVARTRQTINEFVPVVSGVGTIELRF